MSNVSVISLVVSILGVFVYSSLFFGSGLYTIFIVISLVSLFLPPIAKKIRIKQNKKGKALEIIAIIFGGFNFFCYIYAISGLPLYIGYLGWILCGIAYKYIK